MRIFQSQKSVKQDSIEKDKPNIVNELYIKCFNQKREEFTFDIEEIESDLFTKHKSCLINNFEEIDTNLSMDELICKMECPSFFVNAN